MRIRTKLIISYSIFTMSILLIFCFIVLLFYINHRQEDFQNRLRYRALTTVRLMDDVPQVDSSLLRIIDHSIATVMRDLSIAIYQKDSLVYCNIDVAKLKSVSEPGNFLSKTIHLLQNKEISIRFPYKKYIVYSYAIDNYGHDELKVLLRIMFGVLIVTFVLVVLTGIYNSYWSLHSFRSLIKQIELLDTSHLDQRLLVEGNDEKAQLANSFNRLLVRIERTFETEKAFIAHASHELRTPLTSIMGQIEVAKNKARTQEEYVSLLNSVYDDMQHLASLVNRLLDLAETNNISKSIDQHDIRIDELLFGLIDDARRKYPDLMIDINFNKIPNDEKEITCRGNKRLLQIMFGNIIDNAYKYSNNKLVNIDIDYSDNQIVISTTDKGIGISEDDMANIFDPLFRGRNTSKAKGHGIGMAIVKRISDFHLAEIDIHSALNIGTRVTVKLRK